MTRKTKTDQHKLVQEIIPPPSSDRLVVNILLVVLTLYPLIMHPAEFLVNSPIIREGWFNSGVKREFYSFYKFYILVSVSIILMIIFGHKLYREKYQLKAHYINIPSFCLVLLVLLSALCAQFKTVALFGLWYRHEGTITYVCYLALLFITANVVFTLKQVRYLFFTLVPLIVLTTLASLSSIYGRDFFSLPVIHTLFLGKISSGGSFITFLENTDYQSGFGSVCFALFFTRALLAKNNDVVTWIILSLISFTMILTATATSGFFASLALLPLYLLIIWRSYKRKRSIITGMVTILFCTLILAGLSYQNHQVWNKSIGFIVKSVSVIHPKSTKIGLSVGQQSKVTQPLPQNQSDEYNRLPQPGMSAGTGRIYIWQRTLSLIKKRPLIGYGFDTLGYYFPQDDPVGIAKDGAQLQDKPHNMYLGIAYGAGLLALLSFLVLLTRHFIANLKLFAQPIENESTIILLSLFSAWCAYLVQGFFNDSIISTSPIFWILFGASISLMKICNTSTRAQLP